MAYTEAQATDRTMVCFCLSGVFSYGAEQCRVSVVWFMWELTLLVSVIYKYFEIGVAFVLTGLVFSAHMSQKPMIWFVELLKGEHNKAN